MTDVHVDDHHGNTMIKLNSLSAKPIYADFALFGLRFFDIKIDGAEFRYRRYIEDKDFNLMIFIDNFKGGDTVNNVDFELHSRKLFMRNSVFQLYDEHRSYDTGGMDYANMVFKDINLDATKLSLVKDSLSMIIDTLGMVERSGLDIKKMSTHFSISNSGLTANNLRLELGDSFLDLDLQFDTKSYKTYKHFIDSVVMHGTFRPTTIKMSDIRYFAEVMATMQNTVGVTGQVDGTVADLKGKNLKVHFANNTRFNGDVRIAGLPDFYTSQIDAEIRKFSTTACDIRSFSLPIDERNLDYTKEIDCNDPITVKGTFKGSYYDFVTRLTVDTRKSHLVADINFTQVENDTIYFRAKLKGDTINIGRILHQENTLGNVNIDLVIGGHGNTTEDLYLNADGLFTSFDLLGYNYKRVGVDIDYYGDTVFGKLRVGDKHLMMSANGKFALNPEPALLVSTEIKRADIDDLGLWTGKNLRIATTADISIVGFDLSTMDAEIRLSDGKLGFGPDQYNLDAALLEKYTDENGSNVLRLTSDIADFEMTGKYDLKLLPEEVFALLNHYYDFLPQDENVILPQNELADIKLNLKKTNLLEEQFLTGVELFPPIELSAYIEVHNKILELETSLEKFTYLGTVFNENTFGIKTKNNKLLFNYHTNNVVVMDSSESNKTVFGIDDLNFDVALDNNTLDFGISWDNTDSVNLNHGVINGSLTNKENITEFTISKADVYVNDTLWTVDAANRIVNDSSGLYFADVNIYGGVSELSLSGKYPQQEADSLRLYFNEWNLSNFDFITSIFNFDIDGIVNGYFDISIIGDNPTIVSNLNIDSLHLNDEYLGTASLLNTWDNVNNSIFVQSEIVRKGSSGEGQVLAVNGFYYPFKSEESLEIDISFNRFKLRAIEPFIADFVNRVEGQASGDFLLRGSVAKPVLKGKVELRRTSMVVNYLNTKYSFSNEIIFEPDRISFDKLVIYDTLGNSANVEGSLIHDHFAHSKFDVTINTDKLLFFNTTSKMNDLYYGTAITSGKILIGGSPRNISLKMDIKTQNGTDVFLPLDNSIEIADKDYIIFIQHIDSMDMEFEEPEGKAKLKEEALAFKIDLGIEITPQAKVTIFMPSDMGRIESQGRGDLRMKTNSTGDFSLVGDYNLEGGVFFFTLANLVSKRFELVRGGRISWTGDPYLANVNIKGMYKVRTNLSSLGVVMDTTTNYTNKVNVECYIIMSNQLLDPNIRFEIKFPDLDPDLKRLVYAELDTTNLAVMNEQMISLLVLGTFSASNASNISLSSSYYAVLSNQLSSILSKISDDFDIGINYKPGDNVSQEEFEVALSTQLFDDRLIIDGNFGMTYDKSHQNASNIVGDVDIGYKLTEDGRWILKVFNHSNVNSWYNNANYEKISPYTQGVGIAFRKEFTNIAELFKRTRPKKNKRKAKDDEEL